MKCEGLKTRGCALSRFETNYTPRLTPAALSSPHIDRDYYRCWQGLRSHFDPAVRDGGLDGRPVDSAPPANEALRAPSKGAGERRV